MEESAKPRNSELIDPERAIFGINGLLSLRLPGSWWWHSEDINEPGAKGTIFRTWGAGNPTGLDVACIQVVDVTDDPTEPDVSTMTVPDVPSIDQYLEEGLTQVLKQSGIELVTWMHSTFNQNDAGKSLFTSYIGLGQGKERQYIQRRLRVKGHNMVVAGRFDVVHHKIFATPILRAVQNAEALS